MAAWLSTVPWLYCYMSCVHVQFGAYDSVGCGQLMCAAYVHILL